MCCNLFNLTPIHGYVVFSKIFFSQLQVYATMNVFMLSSVCTYVKNVPLLRAILYFLDLCKYLYMPIHLGTVDYLVTKLSLFFTYSITDISLSVITMANKDFFFTNCMVFFFFFLINSFSSHNIFTKKVLLLYSLIQVVTRCDPTSKIR